MKKQHHAPRSATLPPRVRAKAQALTDQVRALQNQASSIGRELGQYVGGWAAGVGIDIDKGDWHLTPDCAELRQGKAPE